MKNQILLITAAILVIFNSCKKKPDAKDYHPVVKTTGAEILSDGSVQVTGEIVATGYTDIVLAGFCMDTIPNPDLLSNQQSIDTLYGNTFRYVYKNLDGLHKYYFRAWAANENGYAAGGDVSLDSISIPTTFIPCTPPLDTVIYSHPQRTKYEPLYSKAKYYFSSNWRIDMSTNTKSIYFEFSQKPTNGVYKIFENTNGTNLVTILFGGYEAESGSKLYVRQIDNEHIEVTICDAQVFNGAFMDSVSTRFIATYSEH
ncbi:MAG: hypothetical protein H6550_14590 [Chitinophagales bacterium]|nr:hypothetical protein [Chitinophagales bacterium]